MTRDTSDSVINMQTATFLVTIFATYVSLVQSAELVQQLEDLVTAGNYTYYQLNRHGAIMIVLHSQTGDADLYISEKVLQPDFELENHDLQSVTCGLDSVLIPASFKRPVGVGVYGHPHHAESRYFLEIYLSDVNDEPFYVEQPDLLKKHKYTAADMPVYGEKHEEESLLWTIIVGVLKVLFDVLL